MVIQIEKRQIYYKIVQDYNDNFRIKTSLGLKGLPGGRVTDMLSGVAIVVPTPKLFELDINCNARQSPRHFIRGDNFLVVSARFLNALRKAGVDNFEEWPAILREPKTKREWKDYFVFNEIGLLDPVDIENSKYDTIMDGSADGDILPFLGIHEAVFSAKKTQGAKMFRIPQFSPDVYISTEVMDV
jgi:hypothetical protein